MAGQDRWAVSASAAENYQRYNVAELFGPWAQVLVERAGVAEGQRVLDVACGTGVVARAAAGLVGPSGVVVGADLNEGMLAEARRHQVVGAGIEWRQTDAQHLPFEDGSFDVVLCQQGLQFVPDRAAAIGEMRRVLDVRGTAMAAVWAELEQNPLPMARRDAAVRYLGVDTAAPFLTALGNSFGASDVQVWIEEFTAAGFGRVSGQLVEIVIRSGDPRSTMEGNLRATPIADAVASMDEGDYEAMVDEMVAAVGPWVSDGVLHAPYAVNFIEAKH